MKKFASILLVLVVLCFSLTGCRQADRVSANVSQQADNFNVIRRLTVINARTDKPMFELVAAFSLEVDHNDNQLEIICETGPNDYKKHFVGLNEWTLYVVEDVSGANVDPYHYEVNFLPEMIQPITFISED